MYRAHTKSTHYTDFLPSGCKYNKNNLYNSKKFSKNLQVSKKKLIASHGDRHSVIPVWHRSTYDNSGTKKHSGEIFFPQNVYGSFRRCIYLVWLSLRSVQKKNPNVIAAIASIKIIVPIFFILLLVYNICTLQREKSQTMLFLLHTREPYKRLVGKYRLSVLLQIPVLLNLSRTYSSIGRDFSQWISVFLHIPSLPATCSASLWAPWPVHVSYSSAKVH